MTRLCQHHKTIPKNAQHIDSLQLLLTSGADPKVAAGPLDFEPIAYAAMGANRIFVDLLLDHYENRSVFVDALQCDTDALARHETAEIERAVDSTGRTPLHYLAASGMWRENDACAANALGCAQFLVDQGVEADAIQPIPDGGEIFPATALWWCITWQEHHALAEFLLYRGADPNPSVFAAIFNNDWTTCELLERFGADWNTRFANRTPLMDLLLSNKTLMVA